jgi:hypothetical protein
MRDDPILDYYELHKYPKHITPDLQAIFDDGNAFEKEIMDRISTLPLKIYMFENDVNILHQLPAYYNTLRLLRAKTFDVIFHGVVRNFDRKTYGFPDMIVRGSAFSSMFSNPPEVDDDMYYIVDIKQSRLHLDSSERYLQNSVLYDGYKGQLFVYTDVMNHMLGTDETRAFLLGNGWSKSDDPFDRPAEIDFGGRDAWVSDKMQKAIEWHHRLQTHGKEWVLDPPSVPELFPNMKNEYDTGFRIYKEELANRIHDITCLWNIGIEHRAKAFEKGIMSYRDPRLTPEILGVKPTSKRYTILKGMLTATEPITIPPENNVHAWRTGTFGYIDIETLTIDKKTYIYLIGVLVDGTYTSFVMNVLSNEEEARVLADFCAFVSSYSKKWFHWGHFEKSTFAKKGCSVDLVDMLDMFKDPTHPIIVKDAFGFSIKTISKKLREYSLIDFDSTIIANGWESMQRAVASYASETPDLKELIAYNRLDCELMEKIHALLKTI